MQRLLNLCYAVLPSQLEMSANLAWVLQIQMQALCVICRAPACKKGREQRRT